MEEMFLTGVIACKGALKIYYSLKHKYKAMSKNEEILKNKTILMEQKSRSTAQYVIKV